MITSLDVVLAVAVLRNFIVLGSIDPDDIELVAESQE